MGPSSLPLPRPSSGRRLVPDTSADDSVKARGRRDLQRLSTLASDRQRDVSLAKRDRPACHSAIPGRSPCWRSSASAAPIVGTRVRSGHRSIVGTPIPTPIGTPIVSTPIGVRSVIGSGIVVGARVVRGAPVGAPVGSSVDAPRRVIGAPVSAPVIGVSLVQTAHRRSSRRSRDWRGGRYGPD